MRYQFDSCSYDELTSCVRTRIEWIREHKRFLEDELSKKYPHVRSVTGLRILNDKNEIKRLLKYRRLLKNSEKKNWDTNYFERKGGIT